MRLRGKGFNMVTATGTTHDCISRILESEIVSQLYSKKIEKLFL